MSPHSRLHFARHSRGNARPTYRRARGAARPTQQRVTRAALEALEPRRLFAAFAVTTTADGGPGSLRQAILDANAAAGADTVTVPAGTYTLSIAGANEDAGATGDLDVTGELTLTGAGAATTIVQAGTTAANGV